MQEEISFGVWLRKQRRALDLSRQAFAAQVGCAEVTLRRIEAGMLKPSKELASIILEKLAIPEADRSQWISFARGSVEFPSKSFPPSTKPKSNLPAQITSFIGREKEKLDLIRLLGKHRLVTLTGSGGVGKTRLSITVGEHIAENFPNGVWLVELASILDSVLVPPTVSIAIGLRNEPQRPVIDMLSDYLQDKQLLIILDNCEHLLDACAKLADTLLRRCPSLKILATSRESLSILGEAVYRVPSLGLPDIHELLDKFKQYESVLLFNERAQLAQMDFSLTLENASAVAKICSRLDGIPLAIELAAAKVAVFSTEQIANQLHESFNLLIAGSRTALPRHQTLRASIDWSWNLLTESERKLMQQLSVFAGGWTLEAAQSVCHGDVLSLLNSLLNKSLIVMHHRKETDVRYSFHETIRQYALEKVLEAGGDKALRDKHLAYFVKLAEQGEPELYRSNQIFWFNKLDAELDNFRMALEWALATDSKSGLRIISIPWRFWERRDYLQEVEKGLGQLLENYPTSDSLRAQALAVYCRCYLLDGNFVEARRFAEQSLQMARALSDQQNEALSLLYLGGTFTFRGRIHEGSPFLEQSLALYRTLGDKIGQATAMYWLSKDNPEYSRSLLLESLKIHRNLGNLSGIADCLTELAAKATFSGDFSSPLPWLEEARTLFHKLGNRSGEADVLNHYGNIAYWQGDYQQACAYFEQAIALYEKTGVWWSSWSRFRIALTLLRQGDIVQARETFEMSLKQFQKYDRVNGLVYAVEGLASLHVNQGQLAHAARLFAWADSMREKIGDHRPPVDQNWVDKDLTVIHSKLNDTKFATSAAEGRAMTVEQAIALALETEEEI